MTAAIAAALAKAALEVFTNMILSWLQTQQARQDQIEVGQTRVTAAANKEAADASDRANASLVNAPGIDDFLHDLATSGKF